MFELLFIGILIGFIAGYFSSQWLWTKKIADCLDKIFKKTSETK